MSDHARDAAVLQVLDNSAMVRRVERMAAWIARAASGSRVLALVRTAMPSLAQHSGSMLLVAAATHVSLAAVGSRPPGWFWLMIPGACAIAGALLMWSRRPHSS